MPIYAYKCAQCGRAHDALQKISDPPLTLCPHCGAAALVKQVTAAGFQLKGSGWYVTDFRDGAKKDGKKADGDAATSADGATPAAGATTDGAAKPDSAAKADPPAKADSGSTAASTPAPAPAPAPKSGSTD